MIPVTQRSKELRRYHGIAQENRANGLTAHGTPRQRREKLTPEEKRQYNTAKFRLRSERLFELGLTTRGTKRKIRVGRATILGEFKLRVANALLESDRAKAAAEARVDQLLKLQEAA